MTEEEPKTMTVNNMLNINHTDCMKFMRTMGGGLSI